MSERPTGEVAQSTGGTERVRAIDERPHAEVVEKDGIDYVRSGAGVLVPILNWCRDCWDEATPPSEDLPNECPECGSTEVIRL